MEGKLLIYECCSYSSLFMIGVGLGRLELLTNNPQLNCFFQGISSLYIEPSCSLIFVDNSGNKGSNNNPIIRVLSKTL